MRLRLWGGRVESSNVWQENQAQNSANEYVSPELVVFREVRAKVLRRFLERPSIYSTPYFKDHFEARSGQHRKVVGALMTNSPFNTTVICKFQKEYLFFLFPLWMVLVTFLVFQASDKYWEFGVYAVFTISWLKCLFCPYKVEQLNNELFLFTGLINKIELEAKEVIGIYDGLCLKGLGTFQIYHEKGTIHLSGQMDNLYELRDILLKLNPEIKVM